MAVNRFAVADAWVASMRERHASVPITYRRRGGAVLEGLTAGLGRSQLEKTDEESVFVNSEMPEFFLTAAHLVVGGEQFLPASGDRIEREIGAITDVYEVLPADGEQCFRWCDASRISLRVYARLVGTA